MGREKTKFPGVYQRQIVVQGKEDIAYDIAYRHEGRKIFERVGKKSEGYSPKLAGDVRAERIRAKRHGEELPHEKKQAMMFKALAKQYLKWSTANKNWQGAEGTRRYENHPKGWFLPQPRHLCVDMPL